MRYRSWQLVSHSADLNTRLFHWPSAATLQFSPFCCSPHALHHLPDVVRSEVSVQSGFKPAFLAFGAFTLAAWIAFECIYTGIHIYEKENAKQLPLSSSDRAVMFN